MGKESQVGGDQSGVLCTRSDGGGPVSILRYHTVSGQQGFPGHCSSNDRAGETAIQSMEKHMKATNIPNTDSISELATFWDTHDLTDFEEELENVSEAVFERLPEETVTIQLPTEEVEMVKRMAQAKGVEHTALIREWVIEKLHS